MGNIPAEKAMKLTRPDAFRQYQTEMDRNIDDKAQVLSEEMPTLTVGDVVVDVGCATGQVVNQLARIAPDATFVGVDLSLPFLKAVYSQEEPQPNVRFVQANGYRLPFAKDSVKVFTLASLLHEIFSYQSISGEAFSQKNIILFLSHLKECLKIGGQIIIKDPAKPEQPDEILKFVIKETEGITTSDYAELGRYPVEKLSVYSRYVRFVHEFKALKNMPELQAELLQQIENSDKDTFQVPAWILSEFLRHRNLYATDDNWKSEMMEQYGAVTEGELRELADALDLQVKKIKIYNNKNHYSAIQNGEIIVWNQQNEIIDLQKRFPTNMVAVLEKNNDQEMSSNPEKITRVNVAAVIVNEEGRILYCQRNQNKKFLPGIWHLPGGEVEVGELPEAALKREIEKEELQVPVDTIKETAYRHLYSDGQGGNHCTLFFLVQATGKITLNFENQHYRFLALDELPNYLESHVLTLNQEIFNYAVEQGLLSKIE